MERLLFLDLDDCLIESSKLIQTAVDSNTSFKNEELQYLEQVVANCRFIKESNEREIKRALSKSERPILIGMASIGGNDITKTSSENNVGSNIFEREKSIIERWYRKPLEVLKDTLSQAKDKKEMFLEERDNFLETDCACEEGVIDYDAIYQERHLVSGAREFIESVLKSGNYQGVYGLSHHNGGREEMAKRRLFSRVFPQIPLLGLRFHLEEHKPGVRRPRSSKALYVMQKFNLSSLENCILIDDSTVNLDEWIKYGGIAILYRPMTADEEYFGQLEFHDKEYPRITKICESEIKFATMCETARQLRK